MSEKRDVFDIPIAPKKKKLDSTISDTSNIDNQQENNVLKSNNPNNINISQLSSNNSEINSSEEINSPFNEDASINIDNNDVQTVEQPLQTAEPVVTDGEELPNIDLGQLENQAPDISNDVQTVEQPLQTAEPVVTDGEELPNIDLGQLENPAPDISNDVQTVEQPLQTAEPAVTDGEELPNIDLVQLENQAPEINNDVQTVEQPLQTAEPVVTDGGELSNNDLNPTKDLTSLMSNEVLSSTFSDSNNKDSQFINPFENSNSSSNDLRDNNLVNNNSSEVLNNNNEIKPLQLNGSQGIIPDSLDPNYGVIGNDETAIMPVVKNDNEEHKEEDKNNNKKNKKEKKEKSSNSKKIKIFIPLCIVLLVIIAIGLAAYRFFFAVNPVKGVANKIREFGNEYNTILSENEMFKMLSNNNEILYSGKLSLNYDNQETNVILDGGIDKEVNKASLNADIYNNKQESGNLSLILINNSYFVRLIKDSYFYRFSLPDGLNIDELSNLVDLKPLFDSMANIIENSFSKDKFSTSLMRISINGKVKLINNYSYTINAEKANEIIKKFLDSINNETQKTLLSYYIKPNLLHDVEVNVYVSLKGLEQLVITYDGKRIKISSSDNSSYSIVYDFYKIDLERNGNEITLKVSDTNNEKATDINIKWNNELKDNGALYNLELNYKNPDNSLVLKIDNELKSAKPTLLSPSNFINYESVGSKEKYDKDYNDSKPYSKIFNLIKK